MMAYCHQCGTELPEGAKFCAACGAPVGGNAVSTPTPAVPLDKPSGEPPSQSFSRPAPPPSSPDMLMPPSPAPSSASGGGMGWILPVLVGIAVLAIAYLLFAPKRPVPGEGGGTGVVASGGGTDAGGSGGTTQTGAPASGGGATVSAAVLDSAFNSDPAGAAARYAGPIRVAGTIATMVQPGATPSLSMEGRTRFNYMIVNFPEGYRERLAPLYKGQFIAVSCDQVRSLGGTTILSGCLLG